ncbi:MAG TPA: DUF1801 domain-containing protein [Anaerolineales bacterium]|nr:DUF1801 domain-containing protein [Anaerolineales bacterium]
MKNFSTVAEYIQSFPQEIQDKLEIIRETIRSCVPEGTTEKISYQMPTFYLEGNLVHFAAYKNHIGFYPTPNGIQAFENELSKYESGKGSAQFPLDKPLPLDLIKKIVKFRVEENLKKAEIKKNKKTSI